jgi:Mn-dependent DtxR family transcriptional regulator
MENHNSVTTAELAKLIGMSQRSALSIVQKLINDGFVKKDGDNRHSTYALKK